METAATKLKFGKATGSGDIPAELLKNVPQKLHKMIFTMCINERITPKECTIAHITPIFTHGDRKNCSHYGAISATSNFSRLSERIIRDLVETEYLEEQEGFRA